MDTFTSYNVLTRTMTATLARTAKDPSVQRETAYYESKIGSIKTIDDFVKDPRILTYALKAWGLEDMAYAKGMIKKVLEGGIDNSKSLANTLSSGRFKEFASVFNFKSYGPSSRKSRPIRGPQTPPSSSPSTFSARHQRSNRRSTFWPTPICSRSCRPRWTFRPRHRMPRSTRRCRLSTRR